MFIPLNPDRGIIFTGDRMKSMFDRCINRKVMKDGKLRLSCKFGCWAIKSLDHERAEAEALRYWQQYKAEGIYDSVLLKKWECFCDLAYYDMWAVREIGEHRWGHCFHVATKAEAEGLRDLLNARIACILRTPKMSFHR